LSDYPAAKLQEEQKRTLAMIIGGFLLVAMAAPIVAQACGRAVSFGKEEQTATGRNFEWFVSDMDTNIWVLE
jgi:penicillin V acylase-like amidase (Ntn superfamily)